MYLEKSIQRNRKDINRKNSNEERRKAQEKKALPGNAMPRKRVKQKGHRADALALRAEERRDKLRKATGKGKYLMIRGCLNGETHMGEALMYPCANP